MKKIILSIFFIVVAFSIGFSAYATDEQGATAQESENIAPEGEGILLPDNMTVEDVESYWESFKENISQLSVWLTALLSTSGITIIIFLVRKFGKKIFDKIVENAENTESTLDDKLVENKEEIKSLATKVMTTLKEYEDKAAVTSENLDKLFAILSVAVLNIIKSESAKTEIIELLSGIKKYGGKVCEVVEQAQAAIEKSRNEKISLAAPTPELDKMLEEEGESTQDFMKL